MMYKREYQITGMPTWGAGAGGLIIAELGFDAVFEELSTFPCARPFSLADYYLDHVVTGLVGTDLDLHHLQRFMSRVCLERYVIYFDTSC